MQVYWNHGAFYNGHQADSILLAFILIAINVGKFTDLVLVTPCMLHVCFLFPTPGMDFGSALNKACHVFKNPLTFWVYKTH